MKALVTGGAGFVGRHLAAGLREAGWRVLSTDRRGPADLPGDLRQIPLRGVRVDVVFHLAGFSNPSASVEHSAESFASNAQVTARLLSEVRAGRFVIASTCQVYAPLGRPADESSPLLPRTPYSASKLCGEALALGSGKDVVVLRPYNHTGPGQSGAFVCPQMALQIARAEAGLGPPRIEVKDLAPRCDFFDVRDMTRAYHLAAEKAKGGEIYNVATGTPVSVADLARILAAASRIPVRIAGPQENRTLLSGDSSKFRAATGWTPKIPLGKTLGDLLEWERAALSA